MSSTKDKLETAGTALGLLSSLGAAIATAVKYARADGATDKEIDDALNNPGGVGQPLLDSVTVRKAKLAPLRKKRE